ncbi:MAG: aminotransferase class V-fold PLP-dependent enzyme [Bacteriovoracaceae bacterium]
MYPSEFIPKDPRFGSGPSLVPLQFIDALKEAGVHLIGTSHRKAPVKNIVKGIQEGVAKYFNIPSDYQVVVGNGGATFLFDMIGLGLVEKKSAHFTCGEFSNKWFKSHKKVPWIEAQEFAADYGQGIDAKNVEDADLIAMTLNETSTGVQMTHLPEVDDNTILAVDATSGAGQIECDISKTDIFFFSPQKVFASEGGFFVAICSPKTIKRALKLNEDSSRYIPEIMNWKLAIDNSAKNQTYNTPAISTMFFLNEQVKLMNAVGYQGALDLADKKAELIYGWAKSKDYLSAYVSEQKYQSKAVATIDVDDKVKVDEIIKDLEKEQIVYGIDGYRKLGRNQFRISLFHNITLDDLERLTKLLSHIIEQKL